MSNFFSAKSLVFISVIRCGNSCISWENHFKDFQVERIMGTYCEETGKAGIMSFHSGISFRKLIEELVFRSGGYF